MDTSIAEILDLEKRSGLDKIITFQKFANKINKVKQELVILINEIKQQSKTIAGFGAPTKATTLLTHFNLGDKLDFLVDDNKLKQGMYSPGHHIPVYSADMLYKNKPDYLLILAWNFAEDIMKKHQAYKDAGGKFILPMPEAKVI
ncbi:MAG: SAM-dependent methyltransferase [uncultured bacterium]|nr:MAG: SAM-dependent methyltransferase [uncultured bacterium]